MVKVATTFSFIALACVSLGLCGCGKSDPNANIPPERIAPAPENLGSDPEYAKQFGKKK